MIEVIGYLLAVLIGVSLGLIGGGGSTLAVPVLVYLVGIPPVLATAYSLFIVGISSFVGSMRYTSKGMVDYKTVALFGTPSVIAVFLTRKFLVPAIPEEIAQFGNLEVSKDMLLMILFALLMVFASYSMIKPSKNEAKSKKVSNLKLAFIVMAEGLVVGVLTGLVGAGGGFLIIPALVLFAGLPMKRAIGTSLLIISVKSTLGFLGDVSNYDIDWIFLVAFTLLAIGGIFIGSSLATRIDGKKLKVGFGWFILIMGAAILGTELLF
jgi:uncharacterized protein